VSQEEESHRQEAKHQWVAVVAHLKHRRKNAEEKKSGEEEKTPPKRGKTRSSTAKKSASFSVVGA